MVIDPSWLVNTVTIKRQSEETDDWGNPIESEPLVVSNCRIDFNAVYSGNGNSRDLIANAVVFIYRDYSTPFPKLDTKKDINIPIHLDIDGQDHLIKQILIQQEPGTPGISAYELEVL